MKKVLVVVLSLMSFFSMFGIEQKLNNYRIIISNSLNNTTITNNNGNITINDESSYIFSLAIIGFLGVIWKKIRQKIHCLITQKKMLLGSGLFLAAVILYKQYKSKRSITDEYNENNVTVSYDRIDFLNFTNPENRSTENKKQKNTTKIAYGIL